MRYFLYNKNYLGWDYDGWDRTKQNVISYIHSRRFSCFPNINESLVVRGYMVDQNEI